MNQERKIFLQQRLSFSLIEIFVVIAAIVILFGIFIPRLSFLNIFILENETDKIFSIFSFLQQSAIASNVEQKVLFDLKDNSYSYFKNEKINKIKLPNIIKFGFLQNSIGPPSSPAKKIKRAISFKKESENLFTATFFRDGKIQPGTIYLVDNNNRFMMALTCPISQVSNIRKYKYNNGKWICLK